MPHSQYMAATALLAIEEAIADDVLQTLATGFQQPFATHALLVNVRLPPDLAPVVLPALAQCVHGQRTAFPQAYHDAWPNITWFLAAQQHVQLQLPLVFFAASSFSETLVQALTSMLLGNCAQHTSKAHSVGIILHHLIVARDRVDGVQVTQFVNKRL